MPNGIFLQKCVFGAYMFYICIETNFVDFEDFYDFIIVCAEEVGDGLTFVPSLI